MKSRLAPFGMLLWALLFTVPFVAAQTLPPESDFLVELRPPGINTKTAAKGDEVRATVLTPGPFAGCEIVGSIGDVHSSGKIKGKTELWFRFDRLENSSRIVPVIADLKQVTNSKGAPDVDEEGHAIKKKSNVGKILASTAAGALIGGLLGGGKGAAIGAAAGAGAGLISVRLIAADGADFELKPNSRLLLSVKPDNSRPVKPLIAANSTFHGRYVNDQDVSEYLNLESDGTFFLQEGGKDFTGVYQIYGSVLALTVNGKTTRTQIHNDRFTDDEGKTWVRQTGAAGT